MKKAFAFFGILVIICVVFVFLCIIMTPSFNEKAERTITIYSNNGNIIETYQGNYDVSYSSGNIVKIKDDSGKEIVISGAVVINKKNN